MNNDELQWSCAIPSELVYPNAIHVWRVSLDLKASQNGDLKKILSADELVRAGQLRFEKDQKRFIVARGMLRKILGCYLGKNAGKIRFEYTPRGKPVLSTHSGDDTLRFNVSHSDALALYAVTRGRNIGIDIERVRDDVAAGQIAQRFFSQSEINTIESCDKKTRAEVFFQYWTRKEAFIKATGDGISFPIEQCDVSLISGKGLSPITLTGDHKAGACLYGQDLFPGRGYVAAFAVEGGDADLSCWHYSDNMI